MKRTIAIFLSALLLACGASDKKPQAKFIPHSDTTRVIGAYVDLPDTTISVGMLVMVEKDVVQVDSTLQVKQLLDTSYYIMPRTKDSLGLRFSLTAFKSVCVDTRFDTCVARLTRWKREYVSYLNKQKDSLTKK